MKKISILICLLFLTVFSLNVSANDNKIVDEYNCLTSEEISELEEAINDEIDKVGFDIVVYIAYQDKDDITALADDYYDYNGYGLGENNDGIILCINYYNRDYTITTCGRDTITLFADEALDNDVYPNITKYLKDGDNYNAIKAFISGIDYVYENPEDYQHQYYEPDYGKSDPIKTALLAGFGGSIIISLIVFLVLRGQLKTQGIKKQANQYMNNSSLNLIRSGDIFLYKTTSRSKIVRQSSSSHSSSGGSRTHVSSSGVTHGGGGSHKF